MSLGYARFAQLCGSLKELARKDARGDRGRDILDVNEGELVLPIQTSGRNGRVRQPKERGVVEHVIAREFVSPPPLGGLLNGCGERRCRLGVAVTMVHQPGSQADG
jgi:hypothetical protein